MTLILAIVPVLLLIVLMAFFKMPGDKSSVISLIVTILIALFGFHYAVDNLVFSFVYGALKAVSPILIIILMAIFSYNVLLKTEKMEIIKHNSLPSLPIKVSRYCSVTWGFEGYLKPWQVLVQLLPSPRYPDQPGIQAHLFSHRQLDSQ